MKFVVKKCLKNDKPRINTNVHELKREKKVELGVLKKLVVIREISGKKC